MVFTAAAAVAAAAPTVSAACRPAWDGFRFFVFVVLPNGDLDLDLSSGRDGAGLAGCGLLAAIRPGSCAVEPEPAGGTVPVPAAAAPAAAPSGVSAKPVPEGEYADLPEVGSWLVHIDEDRRLADDDGVLADAADENPAEAGRAGGSSASGGYPALADREPANPAEPAEAASLNDDDDGVLHTESRELGSLEE